MPWLYGCKHNSIIIWLKIKKQLQLCNFNFHMWYAMTLWLQSQFNLDMCNVENKESIAINAILIFACAMQWIYT